MLRNHQMPPIEEYIEQIKEIWDSHWLTNMGPKHNQLEEELRAYLRVQNIDLFKQQAYGFKYE